MRQGRNLIEVGAGVPVLPDPRKARTVTERDVRVSIADEGGCWWRSGRGTPPRERWTYTAEAPLAGLARSREAGCTVLADTAGGLYRLDPNGQLAAISRGFHGLELLACDDVGRFGAALTEETHLTLFDDRCRVVWSLELPDVAYCLSMEPHGRFLAVSLANGKNVVYDANHRRVFHFETERPLRFLRFLATSRALIGVAEYGFIGRWDFTGAELWSNRLQVNVGDVSCTGDGTRIALAAFNQGVKHLAGTGERLGTYLLEGTAERLSGSFTADRLAVTTLEGHLYWLDGDGELVWGAELPERAVAVQTDPLGGGLVCGFESGRVVSLGW